MPRVVRKSAVPNSSAEIDTLRKHITELEKQLHEKNTNSNEEISKMEEVQKNLDESNKAKVDLENVSFRNTQTLKFSLTNIYISLYPNTLNKLMNLNLKLFKMKRRLKNFKIHTMVKLK